MTSRAAQILPLVTVAVFLPCSGCTTHQCDASAYDFYGGHMVGPDTFVTGDLDGPWLSYPGNVTITVWMPPEVAGRIASGGNARVEGWVGTVPMPNEGLNSYTNIAGQLGIYGNLNTRLQSTAAGTFGGSFQITNATCSMYYARFVVSFATPDSPAGFAQGDAAADDGDGGAGDDAGEAGGDAGD